MRPPQLLPAAAVIICLVLLQPSIVAWAAEAAGADATAAADLGFLVRHSRPVSRALVQLADSNEPSSSPAQAGARTVTGSSSLVHTLARTSLAVPKGVSVRLTTMTPAEIQASNAPVVLLQIGKQPGSSSGEPGSSSHQPAHLQSSNSSAAADAAGADAAATAAAGGDKAAAAQSSSSSDASNNNNDNNGGNSASDQQQSPSPAPARSSPAELAAATARTRDRQQQPRPPPQAPLWQPNADSLYSVGLGGYGYVPLEAGSDVPLGFPVRQPPGPPPNRWVMTAWQVSNFSSAALMSEDVMKEVQRM
jgi:hypothetical protein